MTAAVRALIPYSFTTLRLHRLEAACIPDNAASIRSVGKNRVQTREGYARGYLCINGVWQDHLLVCAPQRRCSIDRHDVLADGAETRDNGRTTCRVNGAHHCGTVRPVAGACWMRVRFKQPFQHLRPGPFQYIVEGKWRHANCGVRSTADIECPGITVRTGAATLMIGNQAELKASHPRWTCVIRPQSFAPRVSVR